MIILILSVTALVLAAVPALTFLSNLSQFQPPDSPDLAASTGGGPLDDDVRTQAVIPSVSVLIPARDEAERIEATVAAAAASVQVDVEVIVLDDQSSDKTAQIVDAFATDDARIRCLSGEPLPPAWNGKQYACWQLAQRARHDRFVFLDADVRLNPIALSRLAAYQDQTGAALVSAFPHQQTGTWLETWLIPMMHFILLGFLPMRRMRASTHPAYAAGCGQMFMSRREDYLRAGTHQAVRTSRHDGVTLPRAYRRADLSTDIVDGTELAECRMYDSAGAVIRGLLKNATEGIATPTLIVPFTITLLGGAVLPWLTLVLAWRGSSRLGITISLAAIALGYLPRVIAAIRFRQSWFGAFCQPLAVTLFVVLQWVALFNQIRGRQVAWRGRVESIDQAAPTT